MAHGRAETCRWEKIFKNILVIKTLNKFCVTVFYLYFVILYTTTGCLTWKSRYTLFTASMILEGHLMPQLQDHDDGTKTIPQDGAPPHFHTGPWPSQCSVSWRKDWKCRTYCKAPLGFSIWRFLKNVVYVPPMPAAAVQPRGGKCGRPWCAAANMRINTVGTSGG